MQTFVQTFAAATTWQLNVAGSYFVTLQCSSPINVRLYRGGKKLDLGDMNGLLAGLEIGPLPKLDSFPFAFDRVEVDVTAADTVKLGVGNGQARYNRANGTVDINSFTPGAAAIVQRPEVANGHFETMAALAANTPVQVFAPASNINGAIILKAGLVDLAASANGLVLIAKASAPVSMTDGEVILAANSIGGTTSTNVTTYFSGDLQYPQAIAAGLGLYIISALAGSALLKHCRYKLL